MLRLEHRLTLTVVIGVNMKVEITTIAKSTLDDDLTLELKDRDAGAVKFDSSGFPLGLELEKDGRRHVD